MASIGHQPTINNIDDRKKLAKVRIIIYFYSYHVQLLFWYYSHLLSPFLPEALSSSKQGRIDNFHPLSPTNNMSDHQNMVNIRIQLDVKLGIVPGNTVDWFILKEEVDVMNVIFRRLNDL